MVGKTNVAGARLRSVISVTYPEGSVCTCSNGTKTLKARDTSGKALFNVSTGTWTVTATDGNKTKDATVDITTDGQSESVTLSYLLVLYNAGDQCTSVTGGYSARNSGTTFGSSAINVSVSNGGTSTWAWTKNAIDVTEYSTLRVYAHPPSTYYRSMRFGVASSVNTSNCIFASYSEIDINGNVTGQCDISGVSGNMYIVPCFGGALSSSGGLWANITKVEIE